MIFTVWVINKAGGLIFQREYAEFHPKLSGNDYLVIASTFQRYNMTIPKYSVHAISSRLNSGKKGGIKRIDWVDPNLSVGSFAFHCLSTPTGLKFLATSDQGQPGVDAVLKRVYEAYADWALKNPFYTPEMPIKLEAFDRALSTIVREMSTPIK